jgi:hypothetical protein
MPGKNFVIQIDTTKLFYEPYQYVVYFPASSGPVDAADQERALKAKPAVWPGRVRQNERPRARARDQFAA